MTKPSAWYTPDGKPNLPKIGRKATKLWWTSLFEQAKSYENANEKAVEIERWLARNDLFYLLTVICKRKDVDRDWLFDRCREVQIDSNGYLDLWARGHYKSTIITFGLSVQDIIASHGKKPEARYGGREVTIGIFSYTQKLAMDFLDQIKQEFEKNEELKGFFPDVLYERPDRQAPSWSKINGITVKRVSNPRECTVEAWGLVDNMPTGKHFFIRQYDDVVVDESISETQLPRTNKAWQLSLNLGSEGGWERYAGTPYGSYDTYNLILESGAAKPRKHACVTKTVVKNRLREPVIETSVLLPPEEIAKKRRTMGPYVFGAQMLIDPTADKLQGFDDAWLQYWDGTNTRNLAVAIVCDPANSKKKDSDYTVFWVVGHGADGNYYVLHLVRDKLSLPERLRTAVRLHQIYKPEKFGWEEYGLVCDRDALVEYQESINYRFRTIKLGGQKAKDERIKLLVPVFENKQLFIPRSIVTRNYENRAVDVIKQFVEEEYRPYPVCATKDMLDCLARIKDPAMKLTPPPPLPTGAQKMLNNLTNAAQGTWMSI